jgi:hypothetical protein
MRSRLVVGRDPPRQRISGMAQIVADRLIEPFVMHPPVERLADAVLHWSAQRASEPMRTREYPAAMVAFRYLEQSFVTIYLTLVQ